MCWTIALVAGVVVVVVEVVIVSKLWLMFLVLFVVDQLQIDPNLNKTKGLYVEIDKMLDNDFLSTSS